MASSKHAVKVTPQLGYVLESVMVMKLINEPEQHNSRPIAGGTSSSNRLRLQLLLLQSRRRIYRGANYEQLPAGGVFPCVDEPLWGLNKINCKIVGFADDIATLISGKFEEIMSEVMQSALRYIEN